ncbi:MAG: hypothetical protein HOV80_30540, partial [Polyangiaceae bacterium]|nr:hypothetical protein [Polyangiaceae bacterium]
LALKELPLFSLIEDGELAGHCSASMIAGLWPTEVPRVETLPEPRVEGLKAILATEAEAGVMTHLSGRSAGLAGTLVVRLRKRMARRAARTALLSLGQRDHAAPPPGAHPELPVALLRVRPGVRRAVVTVLADDVTDRRPIVTLLFEGREVGTFRAEVEGLPIALLVDVDRMSFVPGGDGPRPRFYRGLALMSRCAGHELALRLIRDAKPSPFLHQGALEVLKHAALDGGRAAILEALENASAVVPTIQGQLAPLSLLIKGTTVRFGLEAKPDWPRAEPASVLDQPILFAPKDRRGDAIRALLGALGRSTRDVTDAVKDLLADRASGTHVAAEPAPPADERLRIRLGQRTAPGLGGYVDIVDGPAQLLVTQSGAPPWTPPPQALGLLPCAVRGMVRAPRGRFSDAIMGDLAVALGRQLRDLACEPVTLPAFVLRDIRRHLVDELGKKRQLAKRLRAAKVFPNKEGSMASLEEIEESPLSADLPLMELVPLLRALGKQVEAPVSMTADERRESLITATVNSIGEGDIGIARVATGISISHLGIAIGTIPRLLGFPALGRAQVPVLTRAEIESGSLDPIRLEALTAAAEDGLAAAIDRFTAPASHVLARRFVDRAGRRAKIVGWLWIPDGAVEAPFVITPSGSTRMQVEGRGAPLPVPLGGYLFVADAPEDPAMRSAFGEVAWEVLESLVPELPAALAAELAPYLALVRPPKPGEPSLITELRDMIGRGVTVSVVPGVREAVVRPEAVALGAEHPIARALTRWAPKHVRWLSETPAPVSAVPRPGVEAQHPAAPQSAPIVPAPAPEPEPAEPDTGEPEPRLIDRFLTLFGVRPTWNAPKTHPLVRKLERVISRLPLPDGTVIAFSRGGRPVRFADGRIVIDPENPTIIALAGQGDVASVAAAILGEANRALSELTDAEERRALLALLLES